MFTLAAFYKSEAAGTTYDSLTAVSDPANTISANGKFIFPGNYQIRRAFAMGLNLQAARINAPSLRSVVLPELYPGVVSATVPDNWKDVEFDENGPRIVQNEEVAVEVSHGGAGAEDVFAGLWMYDRLTPAPPGPVFTLVATATPTLILGQWTNVALTFNQTLPAGEYTVIGMAARGTGWLFARLVFPGGPVWRPGCIGVPTYGFANPAHPFRFGNGGMWGRFYNTAQPTLDVLGLVAGAQAGTVYIDVIKTQ